jgi:predicted transcriptional regulator
LKGEKIMAKNEQKKVLIGDRLVIIADLFRPTDKRQKSSCQKHRTHAQMIVDFLEAVQSFPTILQIMKESNLSSDKFAEILNQASRQGLVIVQGKKKRRCISITEKGLMAIKVGREFLELTGEL